jgi:hypothetical protein
LAAVTTVSEAEFSGTNRFEVRRRLGAGAFGVVYEVFDRERGSAAALKTLREASVEALYRLKQEFRALADIAHPNLISLHELLAEGELWFFTMELVDGSNFLDYVRGGKPIPHVAADEPAAPLRRAFEPKTETYTQAWAGPADSSKPSHGLVARQNAPDLTRLRQALRQAVLGLQALHEAGKLHRDIKPSNVLVTRDGRLVLLDFGLVTELGPRELEGNLTFAGTPAYMSPEQGVGVSEASDWYSLGVMLFEALTGRRPFVGAFRDLMWNKTHSEPPSARQFAADVPGDLNDLCRDLLRRDPLERPVGSEILKRLGGVQAATFVPSAAAAAVSHREAHFVGRSESLAALAQSLATVRSGKPVTVYVHGPSGIGKTALVRHFLDGVRGDGAVILRGRCYERESVPYKALDSLIDGLSEYLKKLPSEKAEALLPADVLALARVFPVLRRVEAVTGTRRRTVEIADAFELRRRAFAALRELFSRMAVQRDLVLFIDDLQWGDADSANLLLELIRPPDAPPLLLIASYRGEEAASSPSLQRLLVTGKNDNSDIRELPVGQLSVAEVRELTDSLLAHEATETTIDAAAIAGESGGNPYFVNELVRFGQAGVERRHGAGVTVDDVIRHRMRLLPDDARRLLELVAASGQPMARMTLGDAAEVPSHTDALALLRSNHFIRVRSASAGEEIEPYHDRIREAVLAHIPADVLREHHLRLARALLAGDADPERLALHYQEAGEAEKAAEYAVLAADRAAAATAFDRAARLYRTALELGISGDEATQRELNKRMGDALVNAGRGREAAMAYLAAAGNASRAEILDLERRAAGQLMRSGFVDEAMPIFERITGRIGLTLVQDSWLRNLGVYLRFALIRVRGFDFREREASQIPPEQLLRLDTYWTLATGLLMVSSRRAAEFVQRSMLLALRSGEPNRIALSMALEIVATGAEGQRGNIELGEKLTRTTLALAERLGNTYAIGLALWSVCAGALFRGSWSESWVRGLRAEEILRDRCTGVAWELFNTRMVLLRSLFYLGELRELAFRLPSLMREARERDDLLAVGTMRMRHLYPAQLAADDPDAARDNLRQMVKGWSRGGFHNQHLWAMITAGDIALYSSNAEEGWSLLMDQWPGLQRSGLIRIEYWRIEAFHLRARAALASSLRAGLASQEVRRFLHSAERDVRTIQRPGAPWGLALSRLVKAGIASVRNRAAEALDLLESAEQELTRLDMALYAAAARRRRGQLLGGDEGRALVADADTWMAGQDIKNPARMADMLAPGRWS